MPLVAPRIVNSVSCVTSLGAPERKRRNARSGSHDPIAGPNAASKIDALGWCKNMYAFTGPRKTHPQVRQYVFQVFHCKGVGCVFISLENAFDEPVSLVHRNICQKKKNTSRMS